MPDVLLVILVLELFILGPIAVRDVLSLRAFRKTHPKESRDG
jgi:hypothetical protein